MNDYEKVLKDSGLVDMLICLGLSDEEVMNVIKRKIETRRRDIEAQKIKDKYSSLIKQKIMLKEAPVKYVNLNEILSNFAMEIQNVK